MILDDLVAATKARVAKAKATRSLTTLKTAVTQSSAMAPASFEAAIARPKLSFIGEVKQASPSKGTIVTQFDYLQIARDYRAAGIDAISVLTEPDYFHGKLTYLQQIHQTVPTPLLRKDFVIDDYQLYEARLVGASAVLLIVAILSPAQLRAYLRVAHDLGLAALVEAHDADEVQRAVAAGAHIIGINNRNLRDFSVDFENSRRLRALVPNDCLAVAESGIKTPTDIHQLATAHFDAVLIGETLMQAADKGRALTELKAGCRDD